MNKKEIKEEVEKTTTIEKIRNIFGWVLVRYQKAYSLLGSFINAFNFVGIFTLLLQSYFDIPIYFVMPLFFVCAIIGFVVLGIVVYEKGNFQTVMVENDGRLNDYWHKKLTPLNIKIIKLNIRMNKAIINKDLAELDAVERIVERGFLE